MIFSRINRGALALLTLLTPIVTTLPFCTPATAQVQEQQEIQNDRLRLLQDDRTLVKDPRLKTILSVSSMTPISELTQAVSELEKTFIQYPNYRIAKMFYGYGQLFMATDFLAKKNYMRAAESSKLGFFYIDEAAETVKDDWRMRFLRARMDAFVPAANGRCVVALKDVDFLQQDAQVPAELKPLIMLMSARALTSCKRDAEAKSAWEALAKLGNTGKKLADVRGSAPEWTAAELTTVIQPLAEVAL